MPDPTFHAIVVVDIEGFGRRSNPVQRSLRAAMYEVMQTAFEESGLDYAQAVEQDRGDGIIVLVSGAPTLALAGRFILTLNAGLKEKAAMFTEAHAMRMRVSLHQGLCLWDGRGWVGEAINTAARLVDAPALKQVLASAKRAVMAFVVSDEIYRSVIRHDYKLIDSSTFGPAVLNAKELQGERIWIQVPGYSSPPGLSEVPESGSDQPAAPLPPTITAQPGMRIGFSGPVQHFGQGHIIAGDKINEGDTFNGGVTNSSNGDTNNRDCDVIHDDKVMGAETARDDR